MKAAGNELVRDAVERSGRLQLCERHLRQEVWDGLPVLFGESEQTRMEPERLGKEILENYFSFWL